MSKKIAIFAVVRGYNAAGGLTLERLTKRSK